MTNWRERAEQRKAIGDQEQAKLQAQQRAQAVRAQENLRQERERRIASEQNTQRIIQERLSQFRALNIPGKLADINSQVWDNMGFVQQDNMNEVLFLSLKEDYYCDVRETTEEVIRMGWGIKKEVHYRTASGNDGGSQYVDKVTRSFGRVEKSDGRRITGWQYVHPVGLPRNLLRVSFESDPKEGVAKILVWDGFAGPTSVKPEVPLKNGWSVSSAGIEYPVQNFDSKLANALVDDLLTQSSVRVLSLVPQWRGNKVRVDRKKSEIQSMIGQRI